MAENGFWYGDTPWSRDSILPFAKRGVPNLAQLPDQWNSSGDVMRTLDARQGNNWQFAAPQMAADVANTVRDVGTAPLFGPIPIDDAERERMTESAGSVVGPMAGVGIGRAAMAPRGASELGSAGGRIRASHVSPNNFDRFDFNKVGQNGLGIQSEGYGLYFSQHEPLLESYQREIGPSANRYDVEISADPSKFAPWDKLSPEQQRFLSTKEGAEAARKGGIPGIAVEDASGRNSYVLFDDSLVNILSKNGEPVQPQLPPANARGILP